MSRATISYCGVVMDCTYDYTPGCGQTWLEPGYPACAEVNSVKVGGVEVLDMLSNEQREAIDTLICEQREQVDGDALYEARRDEPEYAA